MSVSYICAAIANLPILLELISEFHKSENLRFDENSDRSVLNNFLGDHSLGQAWLIQQEEEVIGYIILTFGFSLEYRGRDAFIDEFYIRHKYRRQGIGTQTLIFVEAVCQSLEVQALHLEVDFENHNAQSLYSRVGYQRHNRFLMTKYIH